MKIDKFRKLSNGKYMITMDNKEKIVTYEEVILNRNLLFNKEVSNELLNELNIDTNYFDIYNKVIKYISTKMRSNLEIEEYLKKLKVPQPDSDKIISKLKNIGLINDLNYIKAFVADKFNLTNMGPYKIKQELLKHNIDEQDIDEELAKYDNKFIYDKLNKLMVKKLKTLSNYSKYMVKQKVLVYFTNLGYANEMIFNSLEQNIDSITSNIKGDYEKIYNKLSKRYSDRELEHKVLSKLYQKGYSKEEIEVLKENI